ncbi:Acyl-CoA thioesterase FadM [Chitinophaga sp. CF118]|uniref:acyl-CoA thioesterase n=1 Tax=Chitinophaga sp. CF118 TaxID=1884367 RepID=UPI0008E63FCC|nr:thioesterase family protein [Chitinophaga sp. CF118]SFE80985.1 Acyl-CoA thioesterase FadM [Chitinophaga sp. CF118]
MARVRLDMPERMNFTTQIQVTINDVNYGGHVGNDSILSIIHEARIRFLASLGYKELDKENGIGLIMSDAAISYKGEGFHGDIFDIAVSVADISSFGFDIYYRITTTRDDKTIVITEAKSGMIYFDYNEHKVGRLPDAWKQKLTL